MTATPPTGPPGASPEPPGAGDEAAYGTAVEEAFIAERGTPFLLSPKDWQLVRGWYEAGVPCGTVVRAIHETFEKRRSRGTVEKVGSIAYCANAVETLWAMERRGLVGSHAGAPVPEATDVGGRLAALAGQLEAWRSAPVPEGLAPEAASRAAGAALDTLRAIDPAAGADSVEESLAAIEKGLLSALGKAIGAPLDADLAARVAAAAGDLSGLPGPARKKVEKALLARERRRLLGLPPLTLFSA